MRYKVIKKSNGKCCACGKSAKDGAVLHVDHIKPKSHYPELALDISNLQVLCSECNLGKGNRDSTDWRGEASMAKPAKPVWQNSQTNLKLIDLKE